MDVKFCPSVSPSNSTPPGPFIAILYLSASSPPVLSACPSHLNATPTCSPWAYSKWPKPEPDLFLVPSRHQPVSLALTIFLANAISSYPPACCVFVCVSVQLSLFPEFTGRVNNMQSVPFSIKVTNKWNTGVVLDNTSSTTWGRKVLALYCNH